MQFNSAKRLRNILKVLHLATSPMVGKSMLPLMEQIVLSSAPTTGQSLAKWFSSARSAMVRLWWSFTGLASKNHRQRKITDHASRCFHVRGLLLPWKAGDSTGSIQEVEPVQEVLYLALRQLHWTKGNPVETKSPHLSITGNQARAILTKMSKQYKDVKHQSNFQQSAELDKPGFRRIIWRYNR